MKNNFISMSESTTQTPDDRFNEIYEFCDTPGLRILGTSTKPRDQRPLFNNLEQRTFPNNSGYEILFGYVERKTILGSGILTEGLDCYYQILDLENGLSVCYVADLKLVKKRYNSCSKF